MKFRECTLFTDLNGQLYLCRVVYNAVHFVVGLIPGGRPFTATITRELGSGLHRQNVGEMSGHRYVKLWRLQFAKLTAKCIVKIVLCLSVRLQVMWLVMGRRGRHA